MHSTQSRVRHLSCNDWTASVVLSVILAFCVGTRVSAQAKPTNTPSGPACSPAPVVLKTRALELTRQSTNVSAVLLALDKEAGFDSAALGDALDS
jgi:hypothetical protein